MWTTLNFQGRSKMKKTGRGYLKGDVRYRILRRLVSWFRCYARWWTEKIKKYFSSFRDFSGKIRWCHIVGLRMYYKHTKFNQNRWSHFSENQKFLFFLMWTTLNFRVRVKTENKGSRYLREDPRYIFWMRLMSWFRPCVKRGKKKKYFPSFRDFSRKSR